MEKISNRNRKETERRNKTFHFLACDAHGMLIQLHTLHVLAIFDPQTNDRPEIMRFLTRFTG